MKDSELKAKLTEARPKKKEEITIEERQGKTPITIWVDDRKIEAFHVRPFLVKSDVLAVAGADMGDELYLLTRRDGAAWLTRIYGVSDGVVQDGDYCVTGQYMAGAK